MFYAPHCMPIGLSCTPNGAVDNHSAPCTQRPALLARPMLFLFAGAIACSIQQWSLKFHYTQVV